MSSDQITTEDIDVLMHLHPQNDFERYLFERTRSKFQADYIKAQDRRFADLKKQLEDAKALLSEKPKKSHIFDLQSVITKRNKENELLTEDNQRLKRENVLLIEKLAKLQYGNPQ